MGDVFRLRVGLSLMVGIAIRTSTEAAELGDERENSLSEVCAVYQELSESAEDGLAVCWKTRGI